MTENAWIYRQNCAINEQGRKVYHHPTASKANVPEKEVTHMLFEHEYGDSAPNFKTPFQNSCGVA